MTRRTHRIVIEVDCDEPLDPFRFPWRAMVLMHLRGRPRRFGDKPESVEVRVITDLSFPLPNREDTT